MEGKRVHHIKASNMKRRINVFLILGTSFLISCVFNVNKLNIRVGDGLSKADIKIYMNVIYSQSDTMIYNNERSNSIPNGYGENDWTIQYKDSLECTFRHFKTNEHFNHKYDFLFYVKNNQLLCDVRITGKNEMIKTYILKPKNNKKTLPLTPAKPQ
jgi:hypothetical protein